MIEFLETMVDKFTFRVDPTCFYTAEGIWVRIEGKHAQLGLSDYVQQRSGDIAFVDLKPEGTSLAVGDFLGSVETIKVDVSLTSPLSGKVVQLNPALQSAPEIINQDPFGDGWLCVVELSDWESDRSHLMD